MISDEVQTGFGRTGNKWFGIEQWGVEPDIIKMEKSLGNGWPIGAFITTPEIAKSFTPGTHFSTFGGNPISSTAALANIDIIKQDNLSSNAHIVGGYFKDKLMELQEKHELIGDVRGMGLMLGIELVSDRKAKTPATLKMAQVMELCKDSGVLIGKGGLDGNVIRFKPPLCVTRDDVDQTIKILDIALTVVEK